MKIMKTMNVRLLTAVLAVTMIFASSCKDKKESVSPNKPVLNSNFTYAKTDANTVVLGTTLLASSMWITNVATGVSADFVDDSCKLFIPIMGDYTYTVSALIDGVEYKSDQFTFNIATTNTTFLQSGVWKALTGGPTGHKVWKLDTKAIISTTIGDDGVSVSATSYGSSFFHNPLDFYGDAVAGGASDNVWGPWGGFTVSDPEGTISFDGTTGIVTLNLTDGVNADGDKHMTDSIDAKDASKHIYTAHPTAKKGTFTGSFSMTVANRDPNFLTISAKNNGGADGPLWANMTSGAYKELKSLSAQTGKLTFSGDLRFPIDKKRIGENQFETTNLKNVMIVHCSDSSLVVRVKRTYDGFDNATTKKASSCWLLYNFIVDGYNYGGTVVTPLYNTEVVSKSTTAASLVGTYKLAPLTGEWVNWGTKNTYGSYTAATEASTFTGWGAANADLKYAAALKSTFTFNANGTVTFSDVTYTTTEVTTPFTTTYTVSGGYITFGVPVTITGFTGMIALTGKNMYVITTPANGTVGSLWLGQNNGTKQESTAVQLIKQ